MMAALTAWFENHMFVVAFIVVAVLIFLGRKLS